MVLGQAILVISGPGRKMYQNLGPKPEGVIFPKRSKPQGERDSTPHDTGTSMEDQLVAMNIQGGERFPRSGSGGINHARRVAATAQTNLCRTGPPESAGDRDEQEPTRLHQRTD